LAEIRGKEEGGFAERERERERRGCLRLVWSPKTMDW